MAMVAELTAGDLVTNGGMSAVFIIRGPHPIWPGLALVIWRLDDGSWSFDALDFHQDVGDVTLPAGRQERLRAALLGHT